MPQLIYWQDDETGVTESVQFDAVQVVTPDDRLTVTDHPIEGGATVSDHAQKDPNRVTVEAVVSNMPQGPRADGQGGDTDAHRVALDLVVPTMKGPREKTITLDVPKPPIQISESGLLQAAVVGIVGLLTGAGSPKATVLQVPGQTVRERSVQVFRQDAPRDRVRDVYELLLKAQEGKFLCTVQTRRREYFDMLLEGIGQPDTVEDGKLGRFLLDFRFLKVADSETVAAPQPTEARGHTAVSKGSQGAKADPNANKKEPLRSTKKAQRLGEIDA
jgi:hypothetical protein